MPKPLVFRDGSPEVVRNKTFVRIQSLRVVRLLIVDVHFNIIKNWVQNVVYMSKERIWSLLFLLRRRLLIRSCLFSVLLFYSFGFVSFVTTNPDNYRIQSQGRLSQVNVVVKFRLKCKLSAVLVEWGSRIHLLFVGRQDVANYWDFSSKISRNCYKRVVSNITRRTFCSWHERFTQKENCFSPNNLCKCTESPPMLTTNTSIEWNLYLAWNNHLITSFMLELNVVGFSKHQNQWYRQTQGCFSNACVSEVNVNIMKRIFDQLSELQVAKCLIVHVLSSSFFLSKFELWKENKATHQCGVRVTNDIVLNLVWVYHERMYVDEVLSSFCFVRSFSSQHHHKLVANFATKNVSQLRTEERKTRSFIF